MIPRPSSRTKLLRKASDRRSHTLGPGSTGVASQDPDVKEVTRLGFVWKHS
jgi:hypothetical protein